MGANWGEERLKEPKGIVLVTTQQNSMPPEAELLKEVSAIFFL